ncbi:hypothetical protein FV222_01085 [Methylobacterium sp. WL103]|uniref:hypothetical protein n=1 Tax=Methylobacterium sp. WL103 TaxID=2603891 RepID=UPI0011CB9E80|nr:hypothetical protein [Methylobacterium sp. WL103]TXN08258.1 hypothetical protein FV222_01085 [Methylobacterium sp. WL103]
MKRRSARPFTVEIKHTRTSRASLADATARPHNDQDLWGNLTVAVAYKPAEMLPAPLVHSEPLRLHTPARRVLPSLVPMFDMPVVPEDPDVREEPSEERLPRVRRVKPLAKRTKALAVATEAKPAANEVEPQRPATPSAAVAIGEIDATANSQSAIARLRSATRKQEVATLRPGERWKRRLPRALW